MNDTIDWEAHERRARQALAPLAWLEGTWTGEGAGGAEGLQGRLVVRRILGGTVLEARETLHGPDGEVDYEDLSLLRLDPDTQGLKVTHVQAPAWVQERDAALLEGGGLRWASGPFAPRVDFHPMGDGLRMEVWMPMAPEPQVVLTYRRA